MSAFVVTDDHMNYILSYYYFNRQSLNLPEVICQDVLDMLLKENYRSVSIRYQEVSRPHQATFKLTQGTTLHQTVKALQCLIYQSCEAKDWKETEACSFLTRYRERAIQKILDSLPEYEGAKWTID